MNEDTGIETPEVLDDPSESAETVTCYSCGDAVEVADAIEGPDEILRCNSCHSEDVRQCDRCGVDHLSDDSVTVGDSTWCEACGDRYSFECDDCGKRFRREDRYRTYNGAVCESCYQDGHFTCDSCGNVFSNDDMRSNDSGCYCDSCWDSCWEDEDNRNGSDLVRDHDFTPHLIFHGNAKETKFGMEVEVNTCDVAEHAEDVMDNLGSNHVYFHEDCSIGGGFEIVTMPHTLVEMRKLWAKWRVPSGMTSYRSGNCGIHVHVERKNITPLHLGKILVFVNNDPEFTEMIAQRNTERWAQICKKKATSALRRYQTYNRYEAVNLTNDATIEFRIFRGNTRIDRIMKAVEYAAAVVAWTKMQSLQELTVGNFLAYVRDNHKVYPALFDFLVERGRLPQRKGKAMIAGKGDN